MTIAQVVRKLKRAALKSDDLIGGDYKLLVKYGAHYLRGFCYIFAEVIYHSLPRERLQPRRVVHNGWSHWYLCRLNGRPVDPTWLQFDTKPPYHDSVGAAFLTKEPSLRARKLAERAGIILPHKRKKK